MYTLRADIEVTDNLHIGLQGKQVDDRFATDLNDEVAPGYTVFDLDLGYTFHFKGVESAELQLNLTNLLDEVYFGNISTGTWAAPAAAQYSIGAPRTAHGFAAVRLLTRSARCAAQLRC